MAEPTYYLSQKEVARLLAVSVRTLRRWVEEGKFPAPVELPNSVRRFKRADVEGWRYRADNGLLVTKSKKPDRE